MYYFPELNGVWVDEDEAKQIIDEMNEESEWDDYMANVDQDNQRYEDSQAQQDAAMEDYNFGL
jgi:Zn-finger nucleic acid-binding protein